eukprot:CAMPEP_0201667962 /NCGR_PEP_ID=MMETSP0494-20130426/17537_1 /ASSEMBLY_ACC=CAM_ASM_000839 /TAXON_ID=420259 /ORGANISM="Thalassiosira gravida, Strain GMp14c1" /LENGTH=99 /DNA_ID=CAMNT_0048148149 /DNA_START=72 /DNA_END=367 /DNA_ORIENTATION=+
MTNCSDGGIFFILSSMPVFLRQDCISVFMKDLISSLVVNSWEMEDSSVVVEVLLDSGMGECGGEGDPTLRKVIISLVERFSNVWLEMNATSSREWVSKP